MAFILLLEKDSDIRSVINCNKRYKQERTLWPRAISYCKWDQKSRAVYAPGKCYSSLLIFSHRLIYQFTPLIGHLTKQTPNSIKLYHLLSPKPTSVTSWLRCIPMLAPFMYPIYRHFVQRRDASNLNKFCETSLARILLWLNFPSTCTIGNNRKLINTIR